MAMVLMKKKKEDSDRRDENEPSMLVAKLPSISSSTGFDIVIDDRTF